MRFKHLIVIPLIAIIMLLTGCPGQPVSSDTRQRDQQEVILNEATSAVGMPAIKNFRERRLAKTALEKRDQEGLLTYSYIFVPMLGKFAYLGETVGYGLPYATQFTNPQKVEQTSERGGGWVNEVLPQADPNALFSPPNADATWILMRNPDSGEVELQYFEDKLDTFTFKLPDRLVVQ